MGRALFCALLAVSNIGCSGADVAGPARPTAPPGVEQHTRRTPQYDRHDWRHWIDADHDCQDTRQEVLIAESEIPVEFTDERHCKVKRGRWTCPYTGRGVTDPAELDIDHLVPLENANASGGWRWSSPRKRDFANDLVHPEHLVAVIASANRAKGSKAPDAWLPADPAFRCQYSDAWTAIKARWSLSFTDSEQSVLTKLRQGCEGHQPTP